MKYFPRPCQSTLLRCGVKLCPKCGRILPLDSFALCKSRKDGVAGACKACGAQWRKDNKERRNEYNRQYYKDNKEYFTEYNKQYRKDNAESIKEREKQYRQTPRRRELMNANTARRRAKKKEVNETWTADDIKFCLERADHKCEACGMSNEEHKERHGHRLHMDHILPLSEGHALTRDNCQVLCIHCNSSKGNKVENVDDERGTMS